MPTEEHLFLSTAEGVHRRLSGTEASVEIDQGLQGGLGTLEGGVHEIGRLKWLNEARLTA
jgi:hypothetical protein